MAVPKVSIIVPVYNVEKYLPQCTESLLGQTLSDIEIIMVDDGSPDHCGLLIDEYAQNDRRIIPYHKQNGGVSRARNDGIAKISGEYVFFCDSDDWLEKDAIEAMYHAAVKNDADVVISDFCEAKGEQYDYRHCFSNEFETRDRAVIQVVQNTVFPKGYSSLSSSAFSRGYCMGAPWHHLIRSSLIKDNGLLFDPDVRGIFDDGIFMLNVFEHAESVAYIQKNCYFYRIVPGSLTHRYSPKILETYDIVFSKIDQFAHKYKKDSSFREAFNVRVINYLNKAMAVYFLNEGNQQSAAERYNEFVRTAKREPYGTAIRNVKLKDIYAKKLKIFVLLLKAHCYRMVWQLKK